MTMCNLIASYQQAGGTCCLHLKCKRLFYSQFICTHFIIIHSGIPAEANGSWQLSKQFRCKTYSRGCHTAC